MAHELQQVCMWEWEGYRGKRLGDPRVFRAMGGILSPEEAPSH